MSKTIRRIITVILAMMLCGTMAFAVSGTEVQAAESPAQEGENLLVNPDWEDGLEGWEILASNLKESVGDHEVIYSIVYQDVFISDEMRGKAVKLSGNIAIAADDPTQEAMILTIIICGEDGYVLDDIDEDGLFIYDAYAQEEQPVLAYHEKVMDIPDDGAFIRISLEIWKQSNDNYFNFSDLRLELVEKESNPFIRVDGSASNDTGAFTRTGNDGQQTTEPNIDTGAFGRAQTDSTISADIPSDAVLFNGHYYLYYDDNSAVKWTEARDICKGRGGHLVTITSEAEQRFLEETWPGTQGWIGAYRDVDDIWKWVTVEPFDYTNWSSGEPNNMSDTEWCGHMYSSMQWNDRPDDDTGFHRGYYCEWDTEKSRSEGEKNTESGMTETQQENVPAYTFTGRDGVEYSAPMNLFASKVIDYDTGSAWASYEKDKDPQSALGLPDYNDDDGTGEYCLGTGGNIILAFDRALSDGPGADIYIFEIGSSQGGSNEDVLVEVSNDLVTWYEIGATTADDLTVDMNGKVPAGSSFQYVRITDKSLTGGSWPGADIDAVCGFYGAGSTQTGSVQPQTQSSDTDDAQLKALVEKGKGYYYGTGPEGYDREKARECFAEAAEGHSGEGWYYFGNILMNSIEDQRYERALGSYERACYYGYDLGLVGQAVLYENGLGTETDYNKAYELYQQAVDAGFAEGYCGLGGLYQYGNGVKQDELVAMEYYKMALDSQDFMWRNFAKCQIAKMYLNGAPGISQDYDAAYSWFMQAADEGYGAGYLGIGNMYYSGTGVTQNRAEACTWFERAAAHGNVAAMYNVGYMHDVGEGTGWDYAAAFKYFLMAANAGDEDAMYMVGCMYEEGRGTDKDYAQARTWLELCIEFAGDDMELKEMAGEELTYIASEGY